IETFYRTNHKEAYKKLMAKSPDLFNPSHYGARVNRTFTQDYLDDKNENDPSTLLAKRKNELEMLQTQVALRPDGNPADRGTPTSGERERIQDLMFKILQAEATFSIPSNPNDIAKKNLGAVTRVLGTIADAEHPYIQAYNQSLS